LLHWFDGSLVHTKELHSDDALLALDVGVLDVTQPEDIESLRKVPYPTTPPCSLSLIYRLRL
jgi:hypothetical protein